MDLCDSERLQPFTASWSRRASKQRLELQFGRAASSFPIACGRSAFRRAGRTSRTCRRVSSAAVGHALPQLQDSNSSSNASGAFGIACDTLGSACFWQASTPVFPASAAPAAAPPASMATSATSFASSELTPARTTRCITTLGAFAKEISAASAATEAPRAAGAGSRERAG